MRGFEVGNEFGINKNTRAECCQVGDTFGIGLSNHAEFCRQWLVSVTNITDVELANKAGKQLANEWVGDGNRLTIVKCGWMRQQQ